MDFRDILTGVRYLPGQSEQMVLLQCNGLRSRMGYQRVFPDHLPMQACPELLADPVTRTQLPGSRCPVLYHVRAEHFHGLYA